MQHQIAELRRQGYALHPPADEESLRRLRLVLGVDLPEPLRQLYADHGGMPPFAGPELPMRLLSPDEAAEEIIKLRTDDTYKMIYGRRLLDETAIFWADPGESIQFAGMFVTGPLTGRVHLLEYDCGRPVPRWSGVASFYDDLLDLGEDEIWHHLTSRGDYPRRGAVPALKPDDDELAEHYFELYLRDPGGEDAQTWAFRALAMSAQVHTQLVLTLLDSEDMWIQQYAASILGGWRWDGAVPHLARVARHGTHNGRLGALIALREMRTDLSQQVCAELRQELPSSRSSILGQG